jgi:hypothetical protein
MEGLLESSWSSSGCGKTRSRAVAMGIPPPRVPVLFQHFLAGSFPAVCSIYDRRLGAKQPQEKERPCS